MPSITTHQPVYIYTGASWSLSDHLYHVVESIAKEQKATAGRGPEPHKITTEFRDDGDERGEHVGWVSRIEWFIEA